MEKTPGSTFSDRELSARFRGHEIVRAIIDHELAEVFRAVLDCGDPDVGIMDDMLPGLPSKWRRLVQADIALLSDHGSAIGDRLFEKFHHVGFSLVNVSRRVMRIFA